ncbi:hypothetical protein [Nocardioides conyzicola]|uniref:ParB/Sulfiredoxin domain-containing protein n=1 Tax=Nocardioides conyzicola TaxID=1651781 RepID=A0ABP8XEZ6_9ACTN
MDYKRLRASQVRLDPQNPRLPDGTDSDHEAVNRLLSEGYKQLLALARDLVEMGESNPAELPIVMKDGNKHLVLEGNRRFAALKLLANPDLADDAAHRAAFKRVVGKGTPPATIMCAVVPDRETADHWLVLRHTGLNKGVGVKGWSAEQIATHRKRLNAPVDSGTVRSIAIADELQEAYAQDAALVEVIKRVRDNKLTNIGRFFAMDVLNRLHLAVRETDEIYVRERTLWAKHSADALHAFFDWAFRYIDAKPVDAYKNADVRRKLLDENKHVLPDTDGLDEADATRLADTPYAASSTDEGGDDDENGEQGEGEDTGSVDSDSGGGTGGGGDDGAGGTNGDAGGGADGGSGGSSPGSGTAPRKNEATPEKRLYQDLKLPHLSRRTQLLLKEARQVEHEQAPGIACVMARVIVELTVSEPMVLAWSGAEEKDSFAQKVKACLKVLDPKYDRPRPDLPALTPAYMETQQDFGVRYLHQFVHNPTAHPDLHHSRRYSQVWRPFLEAVNNKTGLEAK